MLDIDYGIYLFVILSNLIVGNVIVGIGVGFIFVLKVIGVCKVYILCVGDGLFFIELFDEDGYYIREVGCEYGIIIGCLCCVGWFDLVVLCYFCCVSGIIDLFINLIDVLIGLDIVKICIVYELDGKEIIEYLVNLD